MFKSTLRAASLLAVIAAQPAMAQAGDPAVAAFYKDKTIRMLIGGNAGVSYDLSGRAIAAHMGKHIPGNPAFVSENMPGASSLIMTNYLYNRASRDGLVIGAPLNNILLEPRLKLLSQQGGNVSFDLAKLNWLGSPVQEPQVLWVWHTTGIRSIDDLKNRKVSLGGTSAGADNHTLPLLMNRVFGSQFEIILGYKGPTDIFLAAERGEVAGLSTALSTLLANRPQWITEKKINMLVQFGINRSKAIPDVPTAIELAKNDPKGRALVEFIASKFALARPLAMPPETPADRVQAVRAAFDKTMTDPDFLRDAKKASLDIDPVDAKEMQDLVQKIDKTPDDVVDEIRKMLTH